jgi:hypothetical protein
MLPVALRLLPVVLALLLLAAHFLRAGLVPFVTLSLATAVLLAWRKPWVPKVVQVVLGLATIVWVRVLVVTLAARMASGAPYLRMSFIIGGVALATALAILLLRTAAVRRWYGQCP